MNKQIIASIISIFFTNFITHSMELPLTNSIKLNSLSKHLLNIIAAPTGRTGKDALRCACWELNNKIISQDDLHALFYDAHRKVNIHKILQLSCYSIIHPCISNETIQHIKNKKNKLAEECFKKSIQKKNEFYCRLCFHKLCMRAAIVANNNSMLNKLFTYNINGRLLKEDDAIKTAIIYNNLPIIKKFIPGRQLYINFPPLVTFAANHYNNEIADYLESLLPIPGTKKRSNGPNFIFDYNPLFNQKR